MSVKLERFERLAEKRVTEAIKRIRLIGNLSNRYNYDYSEEHVRQILQALESELRILRNRFKDGVVAEPRTFTFKRRK